MVSAINILFLMGAGINTLGYLQWVLVLTHYF